MKTRAVLLAFLLSLFGLSSAFAAPIAPKNAKLSALAKARDRDAKGRFLPSVKEADVKARAFQKYQARLASGTAGSAEGDYFAAKRELQGERSAQIAGEKAAAKQASLRAKVLQLGNAWGARVKIGKEVVRAAE